MKYVDLFTVGNGLFADIFKTDFPDEYDILFKNIAPSELDFFAVMNYGDKILLSKINESNHKDYIKSIINIMLDVWLQTEELLSLDYDILNPLNETNIKTGTVTVGDIGIDETLNAKKPFNDEVFKDSERTVEDTNRTKTETYNTQDIKSGSGHNISITRDIQKEIEFRQYNFAIELVKNIVGSITLKIY